MRRGTIAWWEKREREAMRLKVSEVAGGSSRNRRRGAMEGRQHARRREREAICWECLN